MIVVCKVPWADELLIQKAGETQVRMERLTAGGLRCELDPGFEYLLVLSGPQGLRSDVFRTGLIRGNGQKTLAAFPRQYGSTRVEGALGRAVWTAGRLELGSECLEMRRLRRPSGPVGSVAVSMGGATDLLVETDHGPLLHRVHRSPDGVSVRLPEPNIATLVVVDEKRRPIGGALVEVLPGAQPFSLRPTWRFPLFVGRTDDHGRVAVRRADLEGRAIRLVASGHEMRVIAANEVTQRTVALRTLPNTAVDLDLPDTCEAGLVDFDWHALSSPEFGPRVAMPRPCFRDGKLISSVAGQATFWTDDGWYATVKELGGGGLEWRRTKVHLRAEEPDGARFYVGHGAAEYVHVPRVITGLHARGSGADEVSLALGDYQGLSAGEHRIPGPLQRGPIVMSGAESYPTVWTQEPARARLKGVDFPSARLAVASLRVQDGKARPVPAIIVRARLMGRDDERRNAVSAGRPTYLGVFVTQGDAEGSVDVLIPDGASVRCEVSSVGFASRSIVLRGNERTAITLVPEAWVLVQTAAPLVVMERAPGGAAPSGLTIRWRGMPAWERGELERIAIGGLAPGQYVWGTGGAGYGGSAKTVEVRAGQIVDLKL